MPNLVDSTEYATVGSDAQTVDLVKKEIRGLVTSKSFIDEIDEIGFNSSELVSAEEMQRLNEAAAGSTYSSPVPTGRPETGEDRESVTYNTRAEILAANSADLYGAISADGESNVKDITKEEDQFAQALIDSSKIGGNANVSADGGDEFEDLKHLLGIDIGTELAESSDTDEKEQLYDLAQLQWILIAVITYPNRPVQTAMPPLKRSRRHRRGAKMRGGWKQEGDSGV